MKLCKSVTHLLANDVSLFGMNVQELRFITNQMYAHTHTHKHLLSTAKQNKKLPPKETTTRNKSRKISEKLLNKRHRIYYWQLMCGCEVSAMIYMNCTQIKHQKCVIPFYFSLVFIFLAIFVVSTFCAFSLSVDVYTETLDLKITKSDCNQQDAHTVHK